jgi:glucose/arabinose dehydrogenase
MRRLLLAAAAALVWVVPVPALAQTTPSESGACAPPAAPVPVVTAGNAFDHPCYAAPAGAFTINLNNNDPFAHNLSIYDTKGGKALFTGSYVAKNSATSYDVPPLPAGAYYFQCDIHPFMNGKFAIGVDPSTPVATSSQPSRAPAGMQLALKKVADGFVAPVFVTGAGDGSGRLFVVDQAGQIYVVGKDGKKLRRPFLDVRDRLVPQTPDYDERGLLGLAFHPKFKDNGRFYVWYNAPLRPGAPAGWNSTIHLSEFRVSAADRNVADANSERIVMAIDHPQANHNSGHIAFGPDGYLYAPLGDGGNANDVGLGHTVPQGNAQDLTNIFGDILRIDVDHQTVGKAYAIPRDNPYANGEGGAQPEIYANGFRNPYHIAFDAGGDHHLYASDAGQDRFEEIDDVVKGGNYGWHIREGTHCFDPASPSNPPATCPDTGVNGTHLIAPLLDYNHTQILGSVVVGGYVYRGKDVPELQGTYVFGDYSRNRLKPDGEIFQAATYGADAWKMKEFQVQLPGDEVKGPGFGKFVICFGQDDDHELYVGLASFGGPKGASAGVYRLAAARPTDAMALASLNNDTHDDAWYWLPLVLAALGGIALLAASMRVKDDSPPVGSVVP